MNHRFTLARRSAEEGGILRFSLPGQEHVVLRIFNSQGRKLIPDYNKVLDGGLHAIPLPKELNGTFYLVEFQAGNYRQTFKVHP